MQEDQSKIIYQVCGHDTFSGDSFVVDRYYLEEEARAKVEECRLSVLNQPEELRDRFWISKVTVGELLETERREQVRREERRRRKSYDRAALHKDVSKLIYNIRSQLANGHLAYGSTIDAEFFIHNTHAEVCYSKILMKVYSYTKGHTWLTVEIYFQEGKISSPCKFFQTESELKECLCSTGVIDETCIKIGEMIEEFFDC